METTDLNLVTYVIKFKGCRYFTGEKDLLESWSTSFITRAVVIAHHYVAKVRHRVVAHPASLSTKSSLALFVMTCILN